MFSSVIRSSLFALCISAAVSAASLSLKVASPESVDGVEALKVDTILTNTGGESVKLLNDPRSALSEAPTNTFTISSADGASPKFSGIFVKYVPQVAVAADAAEDFTILAPGESITVSHDLSAAYNFTSVGEGAYDIEANNLFLVVGEDKKITPVYADSETSSSRLAGNLAVARRSNNSALKKRIAYNGCTSARQTLLATAAVNAQTYAANAASYLTSHTATSTRYVSWFGAWTSARRTTVLSHYTNIASVGFQGTTYDCSTCTINAYAYVYADEWEYIYLCSVFWSAPATGTDSKAGTLVHESSHFTNTASTSDYAYGQSAARSLASSNPANAVRNADNHEYFAENTPAES